MGMARGRSRPRQPNRRRPVPKRRRSALRRRALKHGKRTRKPKKNNKKKMKTAENTTVTGVVDQLLTHGGPYKWRSGVMRARGLPSINDVFLEEIGAEQLDEVIAKINDHIRQALLPDACVLCGQNTVWRMLMRQCTHVVCIPCLVTYVRSRVAAKARLSCPSGTCHRRMHENDLHALLDASNPDLAPFVSVEERVSLWDQHERLTVQYALGGPDTLAECPSCAMVHPKEPGCRFVQCASHECATWFCALCGEMADSAAHFTKSGCRMGSTDVYRLSYLLRMIMTTSLSGLVIMAPAFIYTTLILLPFICILNASQCVFKAYVRRETDPAPLTMLKLVLFGPIILVFVTTAVTFVYPLNVIIVLLYWQLLLFRCAPKKLFVLFAVRITQSALALVGIGSVTEAYSDHRHARVGLEVDEWQADQEESEELRDDEMTPLDAKLSRVLREDHEERMRRFIGADKFAQGKLNIADVVQKYHANRKARKEGRLDDIQEIEWDDIKMSRQK